MSNRIYIIIIFVFLIVILTSCEKKYDNVNEYENYINSITGAEDFMPQLNELPTYVKLKVFFVKNSSKSLNLIVYYSIETYQDAKDIMLNTYDFLEEPISGNDYYILPDVIVEYNDYLITVVNDDNFDYPERFGMIGYSDTNHSISFMFFYDESLNRLESYSLLDLVKNDFVFPKD